jgi:hypothetical protein
METRFSDDLLELEQNKRLGVEELDRFALRMCDGSVLGKR